MSREPKRNTYVGHRYVPLVLGEWKKNEKYEGLSIVTYKGNSYTSKKSVPYGIDIENKEYWVLTGNYDAQVEYYRNDVQTYRDEVTEVSQYVDDSVSDLTTDVNNSISNFKTDVNNSVSNLTSDVNNSVENLTGYVDDSVSNLTSDVNNSISESELKIDNTLGDVQNLASHSLTSDSQVKGNNYGTEPTVVFTLDDGHSEDIEVIKPILDNGGYKATTFVVKNWIGQEGYMGIEDLKNLQSDGWEIGSHSVNHTPLGTSQNFENIENEFKDVKRFLIENDIKVKNFAYPFGSYSLKTNEIGQKYYDSLSMFGTGFNYVNTVPIRSNFLYRVALGSNFDAPKHDYYPVTDTFEDYYKPMIDTAIEKNGLLVFAIHSKPHSESDTQLNYLKDVVSYLRLNNVNVTTLDQALKSFSNTVEIEKIKNDQYNIDKHFKISNGDVYTNMFHPTVTGEDIENDTDSNDLPTLKKTVYIVKEDQGFPFNGVLVNENNSLWGDYTRQQLFSTGNRKIRVAFRNSKSDGTWTEWKEMAEKRPTKKWETINITIPSMSRTAYEITDLSPLTTDGVMSQPDLFLPFGISYYSYVNAGKCYINFSNHTENDIEINRQFNTYLIDGTN